MIALWLAAGTPLTPSSGSSWLIPLLALGGVVVTAAGAYFVARRTASGRIDTTEAAKLWDESNSMRQELRDETVSLRSKVDSLEGKVDLLSTQNAELREAHAECQRNEAALRDRMNALEARNPVKRATAKKAAPRKRAR